MLAGMETTVDEHNWLRFQKENETFDDLLFSILI